jgi:hypothetical protein
MGGIGGLSLNKIIDSPRLILGKNYTGGSANITISSVTYEEDAFAPATAPTNNAGMNSGKSIRIYGARQTLYVDGGDTENIRLAIYDITGKTYLRQQTGALFSTELPAGVYIVVAHTDKSVYRGKIALK